MNSCKTYDETSKRKLYKQFLNGYIIFLSIFVLLYLLTIEFNVLDLLGFLGFLAACFLMVMQIGLRELSVKYNWKKSTDLSINVVLIWLFSQVTMLACFIAVCPPESIWQPS